MANLASLLVICVIHALNHVYQFLLPVAIPQITLEYDLSYFSVGLLVACFSLSYALFQAPFGKLATRFGRKALMTVGLLVNSAAFLLIGVVFTYAFNLWLFAFLLFVAGVGGSTYHPLGISYLADAYADQRGQVMGYHQTGGAIGSFISPLVIGAVVLSYGWQSAFFALSLLGFLLSPLLWLRLTDAPRVDAPTQETAPGTKPYGPALLLIVTSAIFVVGYRGLNAFGTQYFQEGKGLPYSEAVVLFSLLQVAGIFSGPICGRVSDIFGRKTSVVTLILVNAASLFVITATQGAPLYLACIISGFAIFGLLATSDAYLSDITPAASLGTMIGVNLSTSFIIGTVIPPLLGTMIDLSGFTLSFALLSFISLLSLLPLLRIRTHA
jgi:FSR family fosmidomycin resistance protein-like MFS transporter